MARISKSGRFIISAAEVGSFVVCQQAWSLRELAKVKASKSQSVAEGGRLHQDWANRFDEANFLSKAVRVILLLMLIAVSFHLLMSSK